MYKDNSVVSIIAPLNECVFYGRLVYPYSNRIESVRPAGFDGQEILDVTRQVKYALQRFQDDAYMWIVLVW